MRGKIIVLFLIVITSVSAKTIQVTNPGNNNDIQPAISSAVNSAADGDLIVVPAGTFVFNKNVVITKFISFKGAGIGKTVFYRDKSVADNLLSTNTSWETILKFNINKDIPSNITVSGITFKSKSPSLVAGDGGSLAADMGIQLINCVDFVIYNCRFEYFGNAAISVFHRDTIARGLICKNEFYRNAKGFDGLGLGYGVVLYGENKKWMATPKFGSANFIFIEDNTFDYHRHAIAAGGCALYVARYNTITNNIISQFSTTHAIDAHEARGGSLGGENYFSTRAIEAYNNTIINTTFHDGTPIVPGQSVSKLIERAIAIRGGEAVLYNNTIKGYRFGGGIDLVSIPWGSTYPIPYSAGYLSGLALGATHTGTSTSQGAGDVFYWGNKFTSYDNYSKSVDFYNYQTKYFTQNRDFHLVAKPGYTPYTYPHPLSVITTDINENDTKVNIDVNVYPNPTSGQVTVEAQEDIQMIEIMNISGQIIRSVPDINTAKTSIDIADQPAGIYFIRVKTGDQLTVKKIVLNI